MTAFQWKTDYTSLNGLRANNGQKAKGRQRRRRRRSRQSFGNGTTASGTASTCVITLLMSHGRTRLIRIVFSARLGLFWFFRRPKHEFLPRERQRPRRRWKGGRKIKSIVVWHIFPQRSFSPYILVNIELLFLLYDALCRVYYYNIGFGVHRAWWL